MLNNNRQKSLNVFQLVNKNILNEIMREKPNNEFNTSSKIT